MTNLNLIVESPFDRSFLIKTTLTDTCNTPAGYVEQTVNLKAGKNNITINFNVTPYAFVGTATFYIILIDIENNTPVESANIQTYIKVLGDFDGNGQVNSLDIGILSKAYQNYWENNAVSVQYQPCDINGDKMINSNDISIFTKGYISYWSNTF